MKTSEDLAENNEILCQLLEGDWGRPVKGIECLSPGQTIWRPCPTMRHVLAALRAGAMLRRERKMEP